MAEVPRALWSLAAGQMRARPSSLSDAHAMSFRTYLRWDGWVAIVVGWSLCVLGLLEGHHQGPVDAVLSRIVMIAGTGIFIVARHGATSREPGSWFTATPLAGLRPTPGVNSSPPGRHGRRRGRPAGAASVAVSFLSGFWLTCADFGVWAVAIGSIKIGPATAAIARHEARSGATYLVARRPRRGLVTLVEVRGARAIASNAGTIAAGGAPRLRPRRGGGCDTEGVAEWWEADRR